MMKAKKALQREHGADNVLTLIGTRFDESATRGRAMTERGEQAHAAYRSPQGDWILSPIADWRLGDVWELLNDLAKGGGTGTKTGIESFSDFSDILMTYEMMGETTCSIGAIDPSFSSKPASSCQGGRTGCWTCTKVAEDESLSSMVAVYPELEPLVLFTNALRAGHYVPENRSWLGRTVDENGRVEVFGNGYSAQWTETLLTWVMSIDAREDAYAQANGRRRFNRLISADELLLIGFHWARYGNHQKGAFIQMMSRFGAVPTPCGEINYAGDSSNWKLPTIDDSTTLWARNNKAAIGKKVGSIQLLTDWEVGVLDQQLYADPMRRALTETGPAGVKLNAVPDAPATNKWGIEHDDIGYADEVSVDLSLFADSCTGTDLMWWWAMEFGTGSTHTGSEVEWLFQQGILRARRGYQRRISAYGVMAGAVGRLVQIGLDLSDPATLQQLGAFKPVQEEAMDSVELTLF
jgi:DNA sulfur modification protein DndC